MRKSIAFALAAAAISAPTSSIAIASTLVSGKHSLTERDVIEQNLLPSPDHQGTVRGAEDRVGLFSPDGKRFALLVRKGNLQHNTNDYSLLLYRTAEALRTPPADSLLTMSSSSNRDAIFGVHWLADNETLVFLGENPGETAQVWSFNIRTRQLRKRTNYPESILSFDVSADGQQLVFLALPARKKIMYNEQFLRDGMVIGKDAYLDTIVAGYYWESTHGTQLYLQKGQQPAISVVLPGLAYTYTPLLSPDGRYVALQSSLESQDLPRTWAEYDFGADNEYLQSFFKGTKGRTPFDRVWLVDLETGSAEPLLDSPSFGNRSLAWATDGRSLLLKSYLPLEGTKPAERQVRRKTQFSVEVKRVGRGVRKLTEGQFNQRIVKAAPLNFTVDEDLNSPPRIYATDPKSRRRALLLDLNPQLAEIDLGMVKTVEFEVNDAKMIAGLYLPPDYAPGKRSALVIQTHGFEPRQFTMDGLSEWSSGFAARLLSASGVVVLQCCDFKDRTRDHDRIGADRKLGATPVQSFRNFNARLYEAVVDELDREALIDRDRVGIMGFSRTVWFTAYLLTHTSYMFKAAILVDGIDGGYLQYIVAPDPETPMGNGGKAPFGEEGLKLWLKESPGFNLDKVHTAVRLETHGASGGVSSHWEWVSGLTALQKAVEFFYLPDGVHILVKPWERRASQEGAADWFRFWLQGYEDPDPAKAEQYVRWRQLSNMQNAN
jgi:dipeptidyl aminopeptidase/acylaminoacyl peptidase